MVVHKNTKQNNYLEKAYCCWKHLKIVGRSCLLTSKAHPLLSTNYYSGYNSATCEFILINFLSADKVGMYQLKIQISWWTTLKTRPVGEGLPSWDFDQGGQQAIISTSLPSPPTPTDTHTHSRALSFTGNNWVTFSLILETGNGAVRWAAFSHGKVLSFKMAPLLITKVSPMSLIKI